MQPTTWQFHGCSITSSASLLAWSQPVRWRRFWGVWAAGGDGRVVTLPYFVATSCAEMIGESHACCSRALASQLSVGTLIPLLQVVRQSQQLLLGKLAASEVAHIRKKWRSIPAGNAAAKPAIDR